MVAELIEKAGDAEFGTKTKEGVVLVDFYADWCGPCRMITPILDKLAKEFSGKARIVKVDTDHAEKTAASMRITSIPTLILFKEGKEVERIIGLRDENTLRQLIQRAL